LTKIARKQEKIGCYILRLSITGPGLQTTKDDLELTINDTLLTQEAQKRKVARNALLEAAVKLKPVTEEQVELRQAERAFVGKLRAAASI
jgi:hypothetical protein